MKEQEKKLGAPLSTLSGVGPAIEKKLQNLNLYRVEDLLFLLPLRYEDRTCIIKLKDLIPGIRSLVTGEVLDAKIAFSWKKELNCINKRWYRSINTSFFLLLSQTI